MLVVKSRGSAHSNRRQLYVITDRALSSPTPHNGHRFCRGKPPEGRWNMSKTPQAKPQGKKGQRGHYLFRLYMAGNGPNSKKRWPTFRAFARSTWRAFHD